MASPLLSVGGLTPCPPPEIWRLIFSFATCSGARYVVDYEPFEPPREIQETTRHLEIYRQKETLRLRTSVSLISVCKLWRMLAEELLYRDVRISNTLSLQNLVEGLKRSAAEDGSEGYGRHIKRLELQPRSPPQANKYQANMLPFRTPFPMYKPLTVHLGELFAYCPRLETLARPCLRLDADDIHFWGGHISTPIAGSRPLCPNLKRLEWSESDLDVRFYGVANGNILKGIIANAPNINYLFISSDRPDILHSLPFGQSLRTLRLNRSRYHSRHVREIKFTEPPGVTNLTNLVLHTTVPSTMLSFISAVGWQLRVLEFTFAPQVLHSTGAMQRILSRCPNLEELVFHLGAPEISPLTAFQHTALKRIRLRLNPDEWFPYKHVVLTQFDILAGGSFPALKEVVLHDTSKSFVQRDSSFPLLVRMVDRGSPVIYEDGSPVPLRKCVISSTGD
ncbi:hypothetical protein C8R43DRAFT_104852 [Mycena crocata]|nr:hypothetical protein C8R43DRAFT_104852 [Mycena crocata]